jgi:drug/metabolite transporter (DMT)-like permease
MTPLIALLWAFNIILDSAGQLAFKAAAIQPHSDLNGAAYWAFVVSQKWMWLGVLCYVVEFVAWIAFLSLVPLSLGILLGSINIVVLMIAGRWLFAEELTRMRIIGVLLITSGVLLVGLSP